MINSFDDFCLWMYVIIDDAWKQIAPLFQRPGPPPSSCSDSELLTLALVGECRGWDVETELLSQWQSHRDLFPHLPSQSRFNRRRRALTDAFNRVRQVVLRDFDAAYERYTLLDSLPIAVVRYAHVPSASDDWRIHQASYGRNQTKRQLFFGYKLHVLATLEGLLVDWSLTPAHVTDLAAASELLTQHTDLIVLGDKGYISAAVADDLWQQQHIRLLTLPKRNQRRTVALPDRKRFGNMRRWIETVNAQLTQQFHIEINHAHTFYGLCSRLATKLTAHTLSVYLNHRLGNQALLHIKALAFPN